MGGSLSRKVFAKVAVVIARDENQAAALQLDRRGGIAM
jgi:hypothetical protein